MAGSPEGELAPEEVEELVSELESERLRLETRLELTKDAAKPVASSEPIGRLTRMDAIQQQEMAKANRATDERKLRQVNAALDTHRKGAYGYCRVCEEPIALRRLKARPETPFCLSCQDAREG